MARIAKQARERQEANPRSRAIAIRTKCLDCSAWQTAEVRQCVVVACPLWPWRSGGKVSEKELEIHFKKVHDTPLV
tara:strand:+ start:3598 stop:3825 length:228 start_codon:yes stop_codon:yes gene_type:complete